MNAYYYFKNDSYEFLVRLLDVKNCNEYLYLIEGEWMDFGECTRYTWESIGFLRQSKLIHKKSLEEAKAYVEYMFLEYKL